MATQRTILITGATDGIGLALAKLYQQRGDRLVLLGRRSLVSLGDPLFHAGNYCQIDLATPDSSRQVGVWLDANRVYEFDLVIQNAGAAYVGAIADQSQESIQNILGVNLYAPIALTHMLLPRLVSRQGKFVFIGSSRANLPSPEYAIYAASKAGLAGFVRSLQIELKASRMGITAQIIHPGATRTGLHQKAGMKESGAKFTPVETVAKQIDRAIASQERSVNLDTKSKWLASLYQRFPATVERLMRRPRSAKPIGENKHVVITGAAQGIGKALAETFAQAGYTITGIDIDTKASMYTQAELINNYNAQIRFALGDLALPTDITRIVEALEGRPPIDVLIHNAGINCVGPFAISKLPQQMKVLDINLSAPLMMTAALLAKDRFAPSACVALVSSLSHFVSYPGASVYAASKDGLSAYASALSLALAPKGMRVLTVYPGPTRTEHARRYSPDNSQEESRMPPEEVAEQVLTAVQKGKRFLVPGNRNRQLALAAQWFPSRAESVMRNTVYQKLAMQSK